MSVQLTIILVLPDTPNSVMNHDPVAYAKTLLAHEVRDLTTSLRKIRAEWGDVLAQRDAFVMSLPVTNKAEEEG